MNVAMAPVICWVSRLDSSELSPPTRAICHQLSSSQQGTNYTPKDF